MPSPASPQIERLIIMGSKSAGFIAGGTDIAREPINSRQRGPAPYSDPRDFRRGDDVVLVHFTSAVKMAGEGTPLRMPFFGSDGNDIWMTDHP